MSLVGNLEDLGLGDILQIVSLSRKSGELRLQSRGREGRIVFNNGQVIRAVSSVFRENLGDLLLRHGLVDVETLKEALLIQRNRKTQHRIGSILIDDFGLAKSAVDEIVKEQIERIVYSFFGWTEGAFAFELGESEEAATTHFDPLQFMLDQGLNPQWLAMEGSRRFDEKRHRGEALEEEGHQSVVSLEQLLGPAAVADTTASSAPSTPSGPATGSMFDLRAEFSSEFDEVHSAASASGKGPESPGLRLLKGMLQELNNPSLGGGIILLVLRFASELMNRAVIFLVKDEEIVGLGQFGIEVPRGSADQQVRAMKIPRAQPSVFQQVLGEQGAAKTSLTARQWDAYLREHLGGGEPREVFLGPLISEGKVVAVLYGDNLPERKAIGDTEALEIFLSQAGLAMEKALLERRLRVRESQG